jgi:hypothetical protein
MKKPFTAKTQRTQRDEAEAFLCEIYALSERSERAVKFFWEIKK